MKTIKFTGGTFTALVTPFDKFGKVSWRRLEENIGFQVDQGITGLVPCGTTGESPTLTPEEHLHLIKRTVEIAAGQAFVLAGTGSNSTAEALEYSEAAINHGANGILLVDPYYNKPSSRQMVENYYAPIIERMASLNPDAVVIPYIIPGRTGGQGLRPEYLAMLATEYSNVKGVKEATGDAERASKIRKLIGPNFLIFSGDDCLTFDWMKNQKIKANGVISVMSNIVPKAIINMVKGLKASATPNQLDNSEIINTCLNELFSCVGLTYYDKFFYGEAVDVYPNPCIIKALMRILDIDSGVLRLPLGSLPNKSMKSLKRIIIDLKKRTNYLQPLIASYGLD